MKKKKLIDEFEKLTDELISEIMSQNKKISSLNETIADLKNKLEIAKIGLALSESYLKSIKRSTFFGVPV